MQTIHLACKYLCNAPRMLRQPGYNFLCGVSRSGFQPLFWIAKRLEAAATFEKPRTKNCLCQQSFVNQLLMRVLCGAFLANAFFPLTARASTPGSSFTGEVVAIWSKGAEQFVRSAGVDDGVARADRDAYDDGNEGRFLCFAEAGGTIAIMDVMLERYLTRTGTQLTSAMNGAPATRRFTLVDQGNHYYAIRADNGMHVRVNSAGDLVVDAPTINDDAVFAIVPIRHGPNVVMRAYNGDDPYNQLPTRPNEAAQFTQNPADFPVNKVNIGMLQMSPGLYSNQALLDMRKVWNTDHYETEFILPYVDTDILPLGSQVDNLVGIIKKVEAQGYTFDYVILYHESALADLPPGPWSDPRVPSQEEIDLFRSKVSEAHARGELNYDDYKVFAMPYQFTPGGGLIQPAGCDAATLAFIKANFEGVFLEVNGHDYIQDNGAPDAAQAAAWCRDNGLEFGITSGAMEIKDKNYKTMYDVIFAELAKVGIDKSWDKLHYVLHHAFQPYENKLPEWIENTTTENARWLIENVMPLEVPSISPTLDTDGDGIPDLQEALNGTFPLETVELVADDFSTYANGNISGQTGSPKGFEAGAWQSSGGLTITTVSGGVVTSSGNGWRTHRAFNPALSSGKIYIRTNLALGTAPGSFQALEFSVAENDGDTNAVRLVGNSSLRVDVMGGGTSSGSLGANNGAEREWLIEIDLDTRSGRVWLDADTAAFNPAEAGTPFTVSTGFALNAINLATFAAAGETPSVALNDLRIGESWESIGVIRNIFANWIGQFDLGNQTGFDQDADGDGTPNGLEYYFGTDPSTFSRGLSAHAVNIEANNFTFTHPINATPANGLTATYRWSKDLATFTPDGIAFEGSTVSFTPSAPADGFVSVNATITGTPLDKLFVDLKVTQN